MRFVFNGPEHLGVCKGTPDAPIGDGGVYYDLFQGIVCSDFRSSQLVE